MQCKLTATARPALGRYCCKSRFAPVVENSAGRQCDFHVKMWGASSPHAKLTGDLANVSAAIRIGDCFPFRNFAKNQSPCNFRLLQQYRSQAVSAAARWRDRFSPDSRRPGHMGGTVRRANRDQSASQQIWETNYLQSLSAQAALGTSSAAILPSRRANSIGLVS